MDLCTTTALKGTVFISFEYYSKVSNQFLCNVLKKNIHIHKTKHVT